MDEKHKEYLNSLQEWGEKVKHTIETSPLSDEVKHQSIRQLEQWQAKISDLLGENRSGISQEIFQHVREEGLDLLQEFRRKTDKNRIAYGNHTLPPLPYAYDALEPYISEQIMRLHHTRHHQSYVDGLNQAEKALYTNQKDRKPLKHWLREQAFHGSGHYLHTIFWFNMTPDSTKKPFGEILTQIRTDFGSWNAFKTLFTEAANSVEGNGWAVLLWSPRSGRLVIQTFEKHQLFHIADTIPLLVLDVWEHAYYLQHENDKASYIDNWWNVVNWDNVNKRFQEARKVKWPLF